MIGRRMVLGALGGAALMRAVEARSQDAALPAPPPPATDDIATRRRIVIASDRVTIDGPGPNAALAASRARLDGHRSFVAAGTNMQCVGLFDNAMLANRYAITGGQRTFMAGSTACRIFGATGVEDQGGLFDRKPGVTMFDPALPQSKLKEGDETWSAVVLGSIAVDVTNGTNVFVAAARGKTKGGGPRMKIERSGRIEGAANAVIATSAFEVMGRANVCAAGAAEVAIRRPASRTFVGGARDVEVEAGSQIGVLAAEEARMRGVGVAAVASARVTVAGVNAAVAGARNLANPTSYSLAGGAALRGRPHAGNQSWRLEGETGLLRSRGVSCEGQSFGLMWENDAPGEIADGTVVVRAGGRRVRPGAAADAARRIVGVASRDCAMIGNAQDFRWRNRFRRDSSGRHATESVEMVRWDLYDGPLDEAVGVPKAAERYRRDALIDDPRWDPERPYASREARRAEWTTVATSGIARVQVRGPVDEDDYIGPAATAVAEPSPLTVIEVVRPFDPAAGFGLADVLIR